VDLDLSGLSLAGIDLKPTVLDRGSEMPRGTENYWAAVWDSKDELTSPPRFEVQEFDLHEAILSGATLESADLRFADLHGAVLREADLHYADLTLVNLEDAVLYGAIIQYAKLQGAYLPGG
jgi:uncharacterized protein YjbI with pentapeptide repeats